MSNVTESDRSHPMTVRFARRPARGAMLGFSAPRLAALGLAGTVAILALFAGGPMGLAISCPLWLPALLAALVRIGGRPAVEWAGAAVQFGVRRAAGQTDFRARPLRPRPSGTLALPGDAAAMRLHLDPVTSAAMIHDPHRQTLTAVLAVTHPAFALLDDADRAGRVGRWGRVLGGLSATGTCAAVQVLEATVPDPAVGQREWWTSHGASADSWAARQYRDLLDRVTLGSSTHRSTISISLDMRAAARAVRAAGRGVKGGAEVLRGDMSTLVDSLRQAGVRTAGWLGETDLAVVVRDAFDPATLLPPEVVSVAAMAHAGPLAINESWDRLHHDTGWSQVLWISEWPRIAVPADFLHPLIFAPGVRRSLSILARPVLTDTALRQLRKDKTAAIADSAQKARIGQIADLSDLQEYDDLLERERSIIAGHADIEFTGLVTVTAPSSDDLDTAVATIRRAAGQSCCELRPVYGHQMQAFTSAALPLGRTTF